MPLTRRTTIGPGREAPARRELRRCAPQACDSADRKPRLIVGSEISGTTAVDWIDRAVPQQPDTKL